MMTRRLTLTTVLVAAIFVASCSTKYGGSLLRSQNPEAAHLVGPAGWHASNEKRCLATGYVQDSPFIQAGRSLGRPTGCGAKRPFIVKAALRGQVTLSPAATLRCPMIGPFEYWLHDVVQPAARRYLGQSVVSIKVLASYSCRSRNSKRGAKLSEHGRANALDLSVFQLADGRSVTVKQGWRNGGGETAFLGAVHRGACRYFTTVLGPNADRYHHDHFHLDLARHGRSGNGRVCR